MVMMKSRERRLDTRQALNSIFIVNRFAAKNAVSCRPSTDTDKFHRTPGKTSGIQRQYKVSGNGSNETGPLWQTSRSSSQVDEDFLK